MTIAQFIVAYAVCWWLVLFMVLPQGLQMSERPGPGHVPSAPVNPRLKRKFILTTLIAFLPTALIYLVSTQAWAEETIYHVGDGCHHLEKYQPSSDLNATDGAGVNGKKVASADLNPNGNFTMDTVELPLEIPSAGYIDKAAHAADRTGRNVDLSESFIHAGKLTVTRDGDSLLNGKSISGNDYGTDDCDEKKE